MPSVCGRKSCPPTQSDTDNTIIRILQKRPVRGVFECELVCKPSSVLNGHLSRPEVALGFKRLRSGRATRMLFSLAPSGVYTANFVSELPVRSYRTFPPLQLALRFISVALSLKSPSAGVTCHSCPVVLGLSSSCDATVRLTHRYYNVSRHKLQSLSG